MSDFINVDGNSNGNSNVVTRRSLQLGDVFTLNKNKNRTPFVHLGVRTIPPSQDDRWMSMNIHNMENSSTLNGDAPVTIVGHAELTVTFGPGYEDLKAAA